jgi:hypothetical protein
VGDERQLARPSEQENNKALAHRFSGATARADLDAMDEMMARVRRPQPDARPRARSRGKPHPEAYSRVLRTLGDEVQAVRRVIRTAQEKEVRVPELARISPRPVTSDSRPVSPCSEPPTKEET